MIGTGTKEALTVKFPIKTFKISFLKKNNLILIDKQSKQMSLADPTGTKPWTLIIIARLILIITTQARNFIEEPLSR